MRIRSGKWGVLALATAGGLAAGWGCGDGGRPSVDTTTAEAKVSGKVTVKGKAAAGSTISFDPSNVQRKAETARTAKVGDDGSYAITTLAGQNRVSFSGPMINRVPGLANEAYMHDLKPGENALDFTLPLSEGAGP